MPSFLRICNARFFLLSNCAESESKISRRNTHASDHKSSIVPTGFVDKVPYQSTNQIATGNPLVMTQYLYSNYFRFRNDKIWGKFNRNCCLLAKISTLEVCNPRWKAQKTDGVNRLDEKCAQKQNAYRSIF